MVWIILIAIIVLIMFDVLRSKTPTRKRTNTAKSTKSTPKQDRTKRRRDMLMKTSIMKELQYTFQDLARIKSECRFVVCFTPDDNPNHEMILVLFTDNPLENFGLLFNWAGGLGIDYQAEQLLGSQYIPKSKLFSCGVVHPYKKGTYEPFHHGDGEIGGVYFSISIPFDEGHHVDRKIFLAETKHIAENYPWFHLSGQDKSGLEFKIQPVSFYTT